MNKWMYLGIDGEIYKWESERTKNEIIVWRSRLIVGTCKEWIMKKWTKVLGGQQILMN